MKTGSSEKGIVLIALIIAIVMLGLLGAGLVSVMGSKHKSYPIHAQAYQALNVANAGVEFAARYAEDLYDPQKPADLPGWLGTAITVNCPAAVCGSSDSFTVQYQPTDDPSTNYQYALRSKATVGNATRTVKFAAFGGFLGGGGVVHETVTNPTCQVVRTNGCYTDYCQQVTKCPGSISSGKASALPVTNMYDRTVYIKYITMALNSSQGSINVIQQVYVSTNTSGNGVLIYDYLNNYPSSDSANPNKTGQGSNQGICVPTDSGGGCPAGSTNPAQVPYNTRKFLRQDNGEPVSVEPYNSLTLTTIFTSASNSGWYLKCGVWYDFDSTFSNPNNLRVAYVTFKIQ